MPNYLQKKIKVQVICLAYNQVEFIKDALEGFISQKTNFPFEVLVGDDCSTDGTSEIISEYAQKYPNIIRHYRRDKNLGAQKNSFELLKHVDADYLALCEGDDYWTDPNKLQIQVDLLEHNKFLNGCFHKTEIKKEKNVTSWFSDKYFPKDKDGKQYWPSHLNKKIVTMADILPGIIATSSVLYRYNRNIKYPEWFKDSIAGDRPLHCLMIKDGFFEFIDRVMSVYRVSKKGVWFKKNDDNNASQELNDWVKLLNNLDNYFNKEFKCINYYKIETIKTALLKALNNKKIDDIKNILNNYSDIFFNNVTFTTRHQLDIKNKNINSSFKFYLFGILIFKIRKNSFYKKFYLFGFIKIFEKTKQIK